MRLSNFVMGLFAPVLVLAAAASSLGSVGCSSGETSSSSKHDGSTTESSSAAPSGADDAESLGPNCEAFVACCEELVNTYAQAKASCDTVKNQIADAQEKGASVSTYESACKSGLDSWRAAGYCK